MSETAAAIVRRLTCEARFASLATLDKTGGPYASLVAMGTDEEGRATLLISKLARHTQNLAGDARASLLVCAAGGADTLNAARASLVGRIEPAPDPVVRTRYIARHPEAEGYADFADFGFVRLAPEEAHLVQGFGRIVDVPGADLLTDWSGAEAVREGAQGAIDHMNADHADAIALYATKLLNEGAGAWRMIGLDPEGCELALGETVRRLDFPERATSVAALRQVLVALTHKARREVA